MIRICKDISFEEPDVLNLRMIAINVNINGFHLCLVNAYSPTECEGTINAKDDFYRSLRKTCKTQDKKQKLAVIGDFNATTAVSLQQSYFDGSNLLEDPICNDNGYRIKSFCREQKLCMTQTYFDHPTEKRYTWESPDKRTKKVLDYILIEPFVQNFVEECFVNQDLNFDTDHNLVLAKLVLPVSKYTRKCLKNLSKKPKDKLDTKALTNPEIKAQFVNSVDNQMRSYNSEEGGCTSEKLIKIMEKAAKETLPNLKKNDKKHEIWKSDVQLNSLLDQRKLTMKNTEAYKETTKKIKRRVRNLNN